MYESFYKLDAKPFQLSPNPAFFYGSSTHKRALAYLRYGLSEGEGFIVISGGVGTGKSTLLGTLFKDLQQKGDVQAIQLNNSQLDATNILRMLGAELDVSAAEKLEKAPLLRKIEEALRKQAKRGKRVVVAVDEAQNLPWESLEELRMLANLTYRDKSLMQIFLLGQPELRDTLARPELEQVRQRITASCYLSSLSRQEVEDYIIHRLKKVGWQENPTIDKAAFDVIFTETGGVPRRINTLADRVLLYGFLEGKQKIDEKIAKTVSEELASETASTQPKTDEKSEAAKDQTTSAVLKSKATQNPSVQSAPVQSPVQPYIQAPKPTQAGPIAAKVAASADDGVLAQRVATLESEVRDLARSLKREKRLTRQLVNLLIDLDAEERDELLPKIKAEQAVTDSRSASKI